MLTTIATLALLGGLVAPSASAPQTQTGQRYSLFGFDVCVGDPADASTCDLRLPAPPPDTTKTKDAEKTGGVLTLFGKTLCLGNAPEHARCDFRRHQSANDQGA